MYGFASPKKRLISLGLLFLVVVMASPGIVLGQGSGPAAYYSPSYTDATWAYIFNLHRSWGHVVPGGVRAPNGLWCVHPDYRPGQVLLVSANGTSITCTVGDTVNPYHVGQWRSRWVIELSWSAFVALGLDRRNVVDSVQLAGVGGGVTASVNEPAVRHFPETGFDVGHSFLEFWRANGGITAFGYPLSNEREESGRTVQYFERAVFEFHPENPTENRVLLRLLGVDSADGLWSTEPFQRRAESDRADGVFFPETGQHLVGSFLDHWREYGGLRVYGYPISREFDEDGRVVQYFQRAVFEWHPDNPQNNRVLVRRLGADAYSETSYQ